MCYNYATKHTNCALVRELDDELMLIFLLNVSILMYMVTSYCNAVRLQRQTLPRIVSLAVL